MMDMMNVVALVVHAYIQAHKRRKLMKKKYSKLMMSGMAEGD